MYRYGYVPSLSYGGIFIGIFAVTLIIHTVQVVVTRRMYFMIFMVCGSLGGLRFRFSRVVLRGIGRLVSVELTLRIVIFSTGEVIGWIMRLYSHWKPELQDPYIGECFSRTHGNNKRDPELTNSFLRNSKVNWQC